MSEFKSFLFSTPCLDKVKLQDDAANDECMGKMSLLSNLYESLVCTDGKKVLVSYRAAEDNGESSNRQRIQFEYILLHKAKSRAVYACVTLTRPRANRHQCLPLFLELF